MKNTQDVNVISCDNVGNSVMSIEKYADISFLFFAVFMAKLREFAQKLSLVIDSGNDFLSSGRVVFGDILVDFSEPLLGFIRLSYFCHVLIRLAISSFEITRPARTSSNPQSTIFAKANSFRISSYVASSGCDKTSFAIFSFTVCVCIVKSPCLV